MLKSKFLSAAALNAMFWGLATSESCEKTKSNNEGNQQNNDILISDENKTLIGKRFDEIFDKFITLNTTYKNGEKKIIEADRLREREKFITKCITILSECKMKSSPMYDDNPHVKEFSEVFCKNISRFPEIGDGTTDKYTVIFKINNVYYDAKKMNEKISAYLIENYNSPNNSIL